MRIIFHSVKKERRPIKAKLFINHLLIWANGLKGKFSKLLIPITKKEEYHNSIKELEPKIDKINKERNAIVHSGRFKSKTTAIRVIKKVRHLICTIVDIYYDGFKLDAIE